MLTAECARAVKDVCGAADGFATEFGRRRAVAVGCAGHIWKCDGRLVRRFSVVCVCAYWWYTKCWKRIGCTWSEWYFK